ncbi:hypothetical protein K435DRAFT_591362, partial [Dendrothele bispora CBS 962.96]
LPNLPPELWIMIIRYACLPGPDEVGIAVASLLVDHPLYTSPHRQTPAYKLYLRLMDQKRSFALVSKMWNAYAQPALYEWVWLSNKRQAKALALTLLCQVSKEFFSSPIFFSLLHIETTVLARCNPADIRTILDYAPRLVSFSDYSGMRRNLSEEALERDGGVSGMLRVLGPLPLKRLTWTCYGDGADLVEVERSPSSSSSYAALEYLELDFNTMAGGGSVARSKLLNDYYSNKGRVVLPHLQTLVLTLDQSALGRIARWELPKLSNLSIRSGGGGTGETGWELFFLAHGRKVRMLELDEDDEEAEEALLDAEDVLLAGGLPEILTGLRVFITNAGCASWDWTNPDWIAPHALLPNHTGVEIVGVRGLEGRMWGAWGEWVGHLRANPPLSPSPDPLDPYSSDESPFFMLFEQLSSLLQPETFPALKYIRDLSEGSDLMRRGEIGFWQRLLERTKARGVWLEDWRGLNVT